MGCVNLPNLPDRPVSLAVVDGRINDKIEKGIGENGVHIIKTRRYPGLYEAVSFHPDIMLHHINNDRIVYAPGTGKELIHELEESGFKLVKGETELSIEYPGDIAYNVARVGEIAFHNLKYTDPVVKNELNKLGVELINVNQGYSKCSISVLDRNCIITEDKGIARAAEKRGIDVLLVEQEKNISLPGLKNGFIGGSTGLLDKNKWAITGELKTLKSANIIRQFLNYKGIEIITLSKGQVVDIGTIIPLKSL